jgi:hypothetical protein
LSGDKAIIAEECRSSTIILFSTYKCCNTTANNAHVTVIVIVIVIAVVAQHRAVTFSFHVPLKLAMTPNNRL